MSNINHNYIALILIIILVGLVSSLVILDSNDLLATGRFNIPLPWVLTSEGDSIDANNDGVIATSVLPYKLVASSTKGGVVTAPGEGTYSYEPGTNITLIASSTGGIWWKWTGDTHNFASTSASSTSITATYGKDWIVANFKWELSASSTLGGSVESPGEGTYYYPDEKMVDIIASPDWGYVFDSWTGDTGTIADISTGSTTITMNDNYGITANFTEGNELTTGSSEGGSVTEPGEGTYIYKDGAVVDIIANSDSDLPFTGWTGDTDTIAATSATDTTITMDDNYSITANFGVDLTVTSTGSGVVTQPGQGIYSYEPGTTVDITASSTGDPWYRWTGDTTDIADASSTDTTITMNDHCSITAKFGTYCEVRSDGSYDKDGDAVYCFEDEMWTTNNQGDMDQSEAETYCSNLDFAGFTDWYLPDQGDLLDYCEVRDDDSGDYWATGSCDMFYGNGVTFDDCGEACWAQGGDHGTMCMRTD